MKPIPYRDLDLPIGPSRTGFRNPRVAFAGGRGQRRRGVPFTGRLTTRALQYLRPLPLLNTTSLAYPGHWKILLDASCK
jgi:hypothetical protein